MAITTTIEQASDATKTTVNLITKSTTIVTSGASTTFASGLLTNIPTATSSTSATSSSSSTAAASSSSSSGGVGTGAIVGIVIAILALVAIALGIWGYKVWSKTKQNKQRRGSLELESSGMVGGMGMAAMPEMGDRKTPSPTYEAGGTGKPEAWRNELPADAVQRAELGDVNNIDTLPDYRRDQSFGIATYPTEKPSATTVSRSDLQGEWDERGPPQEPVELP